MSHQGPARRQKVKPQRPEVRRNQALVECGLDSKSDYSEGANVHVGIGKQDYSSVPPSAALFTSAMLNVSSPLLRDWDAAHESGLLGPVAEEQLPG